jgi:hypothetical protein
MSHHRLQAAIETSTTKYEVVLKPNMKFPRSVFKDLVLVQGRGVRTYGSDKVIFHNPECYTKDGGMFRMRRLMVNKDERESLRFVTHIDPETDKILINMYLETLKNTR